MKHYNFLIKPASGMCNMRCKYCFYEDELKQRTNNSLSLMSTETSHSIIKKAFENARKNDIISFAFQGGEPTLAGINFFIDFVSVSKQHNKYGCKVNYAIQTNGLLIDDNWMEFLRENNFLVGISVDGDKPTHDLHRIDAKSKGTWNRVEKSTRKLINAGVQVNALCVVTRCCARSPQKIYNSIKKLGFKYMQMIACLDPIEQSRGNMPYSLTPKDYGNFLCELFDLWYADWQSNNYISIGYFDDLVNLAVGIPPATCATCGFCSPYFVIESDGNVYPCDFYALDSWKMGNINSNSLDQLIASPQSQNFLKAGLKKPDNCSFCHWKGLCAGGCKRDWINVNGKPQNYFCESFKMLFAHAESKILQIALT